MVKSTLKSAGKALELPEVYLRILTDYIQLVSFIGLFNLNWPDSVKQLFEV